MSDKTLSGIVNRLESTTADLKEVQSHLKQFQKALNDLVGFGQKFEQAVAKQDLVWLVNIQQNLKDIVQTLQTSSKALINDLM